MGGAGVSWLELVSVIAGLTCVVMAGRNNKYNFWVGYIYNILLFLLFWQRHLYSAMLLQPIAFGINAFGHWRWTHPKEDERSSLDASALKVSRLDMRGWCIALTVVVAAGLYGDMFSVNLEPLGGRKLSARIQLPGWIHSY